MCCAASVRQAVCLAPQAPRPFVSDREGKMSYEDFCWFILSEEDKSNDVSLEYWFRCVDLDCDGTLRSNELLVRADRQTDRLVPVRRP
jgi:serine/threonine-protein phosphatase 2A regulatory subunit B''